MQDELQIFQQFKLQQYEQLLQKQHIVYIQRFFKSLKVREYLTAFSYLLSYENKVLQSKFYSIFIRAHKIYKIQLEACCRKPFQQLLELVKLQLIAVRKHHNILYKIPMTYMTEHIFVFQDKVKSIEAMNKVIQFKQDHLKSHFIDILRYMNRRVEFYVYQMKRKQPKANLEFLDEFPTDSYYFNKYRYKMQIFIQNLQHISHQLNLDLQYKVLVLWRNLVPREHLVKVIAYRHLLRNYIRYIHAWHLYCKTRKYYTRYWFIKWGQYTLVNVGQYQQKHFVTKLERHGLLNHNFQKWKKAVSIQNFINQSFYLKLYYDFNQLRAKELSNTNSLLSYIIFFFMQFNYETKFVSTGIKCLKHWKRISQTRQQYFKFVQLIKCRHLCTTGKTCIRAWKRLISYKKQSGTLNKDENGDVVLPLNITQKLEEATINMMFSQEEVNYDCDIAHKRPDLAFIEMQERQNVDEANSYLLYKLKQIILTQDKQINTNQAIRIIMFESQNTQFVHFLVKSLAILLRSRKQYLRQNQKVYERKFNGLTDIAPKLAVLEDIETERDRYLQQLRKTEEQMAIRYIDFGVAVEALMDRKLTKLRQLRPQSVAQEPPSGARTDVLRGIQRKYPAYERYAASIQGSKMALLYQAMYTSIPALLTAGNTELNSASYTILCQLAAKDKAPAPNNASNIQQQDEGSQSQQSQTTVSQDKQKNNGIGPQVIKILNNSVYRVQFNIARDYAESGTATLDWPPIETKKTTQMALENLRYRQRAGNKPRFRLPLEFPSWVASWLLLATQREADQVSQIRHSFLKGAARRLRIRRGESSLDAENIILEAKKEVPYISEIQQNVIQQMYEALGVVDDDEAKDLPSEIVLGSSKGGIELLKNALEFSQDTSALVTRKRATTADFGGESADDFLLEPKLGSEKIPDTESTEQDYKQGRNKPNNGLKQSQRTSKGLYEPGEEFSETLGSENAVSMIEISNSEQYNAQYRSESQKTREKAMRSNQKGPKNQNSSRSLSEIAAGNSQDKYGKIPSKNKRTPSLNNEKGKSKPPQILGKNRTSKISLPGASQFNDEAEFQDDNQTKYSQLSEKEKENLKKLGKNIPGAQSKQNQQSSSISGTDKNKVGHNKQDSKTDAQGGKKRGPSDAGEKHELAKTKVISKAEREAMKYKEGGDELDNVHEVLDESGRKIFVKVNQDGTRTILDKKDVSKLKKDRENAEKQRQTLERGKAAAEKAANAQSIDEYFAALLEGAATEDEIERVKNLYQQAQAAGLSLDQLKNMAKQAAAQFQDQINVNLGSPERSTDSQGAMRGQLNIADVLIAQAAKEPTNSVDTGAGRALYNKNAFDALLNKQKNAVKKAATQLRQLKSVLKHVYKVDKELIGVKVDDLTESILKNIISKQSIVIENAAEHDAKSQSIDTRAISPTLTRTYNESALQIVINQLLEESEQIEQLRQKKLNQTPQSLQKSRPMLRPETKPARKMCSDDLLLANSYAFAPVTMSKQHVVGPDGKRFDSLLLTQTHKFEFRKLHLIAKRSKSMPQLIGPLNFAWLDRMRPKSAAVLNPATAEKKYKLRGINKAQQLIDNINSIQLSPIQAGKPESPNFAKHQDLPEPVEFQRIDDIFTSNYFTVTTGNYSFEVPVLTKRQQKLIRRFKSDDDVDMEILDFSNNEIDEYDSLFNQDSRMNLEKLITMRKNDLQKALQLEMQHDEVARKLYIYKTGGATNIDDISADDLDAIRKYNQMLITQEEERVKSKILSKSKIRQPTFKQKLENEKLLFSQILYKMKQKEQQEDRQRKLDNLFTKRSVITDKMPLVDKSQVKQYSWQMSTSERTLYQITNRSQKDGSKIIRRVLNPVPASVVPRMNQYVNDLEEREYQLQQDKKLIEQLLKTQNFQ